MAKEQRPVEFDDDFESFMNDMNDDLNLANNILDQLLSTQALGEDIPVVPGD